MCFVVVVVLVFTATGSHCRVLIIAGLVIKFACFLKEYAGCSLEEQIEWVDRVELQRTERKLVQ